MPRCYLFEFEDQSWFPNVIREGMMDYLRHMISWMRFYKPAAAIIKNTLDDSQLNQLLELCAGSGGGIIKFQSYLNEMKCDPQIILSDLYPNISTYEGFKKSTNGKIDFVKEPVNALNVRQHFTGMRIMFSAFHHFKPNDARKILEDAAVKNVPIAIFDAGTTNPFYILSVLLLQPFSFFFLTPFFKPFRWSRLLFTYLIPLIPLCTLWDGSVSVLRFYTLNEMKAITDSIVVPGYLWEVGMRKNPLGVPINFILGKPEKVSNNQLPNSFESEFVLY